MIEAIFEILFEPIVYLVGLISIKIFTLGRQPTPLTKEKYEATIEVVGGFVCMVLLLVFWFLVF